MRESAQSWRELLVDIKARGLAVPPEVAVGDGAMGFWKALDEVFPGTRHQRCCPLGDASIACRVTGPQDRQRAEQVPEIDAADGEGRPAQDLPLVTLLRNALPGSGQAETRAKAAMDIFAEKYGIKYEKAVTCLTKDRDTLLAFYGSPTVLASNCPPDSLPPAADRRELPADHWDHLRTSNPIESIFCHHSPPDRADQGGAVANDSEADGVQACSDRRQNMAPPEGREPVANGHRRSQIHRRCRRQQRRKPRRLIRPRHPNSSIAQWRCITGATFGSRGGPSTAPRDQPRN